MKNTARQSKGSDLVAPNLVDRWLTARRELIAAYCAISATLGTETSSVRLRKRLGRFLDLLVDYVSEGHFEVYGELLAVTDAEPSPVNDLMCKIYPSISKSTELALTFDDYCASDDLSDTRHLQTRLSELGEIMEARFASEDQLIAAVRNPHPLAA